MRWGSFLIVIVTPCLFLSSDAVNIKRCVHGTISITAHTDNTVECDEFDSGDTVIWQLGTSHVTKTLFTCPANVSCMKNEEDKNITGAERPLTLETNVKLFLTGSKSLEGLMLTCRITSTRLNMGAYVVCTIHVQDAQVTTHEPNSKLEVTTKAGSNTRLKPEDSSGNELPVGAIAGGSVAAVAVIVVVVVVVVIIRRRRRRDKHAAVTNAQDSNEVGTRNNAAYGTVGDAGDLNQPHDAGSPEIGIYAFPGGDAPATIPDNTPAAEKDNFGMYAAPKQDVYAAVDKSKQKKNKPATSDHPDTSQASVVGDEYAVVNKASKKKEASNSTGISDAHIPKDNDATAAPTPYIYAQVDKTARNAKTAVSVPSTPEEEGATYAQVQKPKKK